MDRFKEALQKPPVERAESVVWKICALAHRIVRGISLRLLPRDLVNARAFSNVLLRKYGGHFSGDVINVSGWDDGDKEGGMYREYFPRKRSYTVSNAKTAAKGFGAMQGTGIAEIELDLDEPVKSELHGTYDVVFNHTTLEHVLHFEQAFENLCVMSRDAVLIVVPTLQQVHFADGFGDYWRPTPITIAKLFYANGFTPLVITTNDQAFGAVYIFAIGVRKPDAYPQIEVVAQFDSGGRMFGSPLPHEKLSSLFTS